MRVSNVLVRRAHEDDLPRLGELLRDCVAHMRSSGIDQWDEVYPDETTLRADVDAGTLYVAAAPDHPIAGAFVVDQHQEPEYATVPWRIAPAGAPVGVVHRLMVHPSCQRRGLARHLMGFAELAARRLGCGAMRLDAFTGNAPSLRLYESLGYRDAGIVRFRKGVFRCLEKDLAPRARIAGVTRAELLRALRAERHATVASVSADGAPQAAVVGVVVSEDFEIFFDTLDVTHKATNLRARPRAALVLGSVAADAQMTVQLEGIADEPSGADLERLKTLHFDRFLDGPARQAWKGLIYVRIRPTWVRVSDYAPSQPRIVEFDATALKRLK
jgi:GNAT superfamily N-acetyltransferase